MSLTIVHLATDAIAGMPFKLVSALQAQSPFSVRLIETKHRKTYPQDMVFSDSIDEAVELIQKADIIHFHNNLDLSSRAFAPIDFTELQKKGTRFVRQFHSIPSTIARKMNCSVEEILSSTIPSLVIGQYPERYFPNAKVVPNCIPINDDSYMPLSRDENLKSDILFSPSKKASAWSERWNTKGMPETIRMLKKLKKQRDCRVEVVTDSPLDKVLYKKRRSYIVLEEMVTGSYHLSGLEGLSMGKATLCYLDKRVEFVMKQLSGADSLPFVNTMLEHSEKVLAYLLANRGTGDELGAASRKWMEQYWNEEVLMRQFADIYYDLMKDPNLVCRQPELEVGDGLKHFSSITVPDLVYKSRKNKKYYTTAVSAVKNWVYIAEKNIRRKRKKWVQEKHPGKR